MSIRPQCVVLLALAASAGCDLPESPTSPARDGASVAPRYSFTGGSGTLLGGTNEGELVEIDLDLGTVTLIGDVGTYSGKTLGWTDIALDASGTLFALSRHLSESGTDCFGGPCNHLYEIDPQNGAAITEIGSAGHRNLGEIDFAGDSLFGAGWYDLGEFGRLFTIDPTTADLTFRPDTGTSGFGPNPYWTGDDLNAGGFAVHPVTGEFWGIENRFSNAPAIYRIDRSTGVADSIMRLGLGGQELPWQSAFDGLHILADGTFIAARGGQSVQQDSALWEVSSVPDPVSGFAEIAVIPLTFDPLIVGHVNGLESPPEAEDLLVDAECDNLSPVRAETLACTVVPSNAEGTVSFEWVFRPDSTVVFPSQDAPKFLPSADVLGPSGPSANSWGGRVVSPGWIVVGGTTPTQEAADSIHIAVQPRAGPAWETPDSLVGPTQDANLTSANHPVVGTTRLVGLNLDEDGDDDFGWDGSREDAPPISDNGPNHGYFYVDSAGYRWDRSFWVNGHITPSGPVHPVYQGQKNHWNGLVAMVPGATPQALLDGVTAHEGYGTGAGQGHQGRMRDAMTGEKCGNINRLMERVVGDGPAFVDLVTQVLNESVTYLGIETEETNVGNNYADAEHVLGQNPNQDGGIHVYDGTLQDMKSFTHTPHTLQCN